MLDPGPQDVTADDSDHAFSISYGPNSGPWTRFGRSTQYLDGYIHATNQSSATISFSFFGEVLWYYSDLDTNRGSYALSVDNQPATHLSAFADSHLAVTALYTHKLDPGPHTVVLTNTEQGKYMGLDYFVFRPVDTSTARDVSSEDMIVQANDTSVLYQPPDQWAIPSSLPSGGGPVYKQTFKQGASVSFSFTGDYIWYYSDKSNTNGAFQVAVDNETPRLYSAHDVQPMNVQALFSLSLSPGTHSITVTNMQDNTGTGLGYFAFHPLAGSSPASNSASPSASQSLVPTQLPENAQDLGSALSAGAIVGIVLGALAAVILLLLLTSILLRRRRQRTPIQDTGTIYESPLNTYRTSQMTPVVPFVPADSYAPSSALPEYSESEPESRTAQPRRDTQTKHVYTPGGTVV